MRTLIVLAALLGQQRPQLERLPADIDAAKEARLSERQIFANEVLRVSEIKVPAGVKELHFEPDSMGFFLIRSQRVIWHHSPVVIRGEALHVEFMKARVVTPVAAREGILFENSVVVVTNFGKADGPKVEWLPKEKALVLRQGGGSVKVQLKF